MVVPIIDQHGILAFEHEGHAPVAVYRDRVVPRQLPRERMQSPSRHIHVLSCLGNIQPRQLAPKSARVMWLDTGLAASLEEALQSLV